MTDAVISWVDGNDPEHNAKRNYWAAFENQSKHSVKGMKTTRFACNGEVWFNIKLLRKNAPWIDTIFLVTDNQRPEWLTEKVQADLGVVVVDHKQLFKGYEDCLPVFSSRSIETMLPFIPNISEQFLYLNDDFFMINPSSRSDYFIVDGQLQSIWRGRWVDERSVRSRFKRILTRLSRLGGYSFSNSDGFVGRRAERSMMGEHYLKRYFSMAHAPYPIDRDLMKKMLAFTGLMKQNIQFKFRSEKQFQPLTFLAHTGFDNDQAVLGPNDWRYISCLRHSDQIIRNRLEMCKSDRTIKSLCVQSLDSASLFSNGLISDFLNEKLNG
jgi:hypothetical protein